VVEFLQAIVRGLNVGRDGTHVAAVSFGQYNWSSLTILADVGLLQAMMLISISI
jgi:hypothetical protein